MKNVRIVKSIVVFCCILIAGIQGCKSSTVEMEPAVSNVSAIDATKLYLQGVKLSANQVAALEKKLDGSSADVKIIAELLGYYAIKSIGNKELRTKRQGHIFWLIQNYPGTGVLYYSSGDLMSDYDDVSTASMLWKEQLAKNPGDSKILWNVASTMFSCNKKLTEDCLLKGELMEPEKPDWPRKLGLFYSLNNAPEKALQKYKSADKLRSSSENRSELPYMAAMAFKCEKYDEASQYAHDMLRIAESNAQKQVGIGRMVYSGNYTLGQIALAQGNVADAEKYLLAAGKTPGSPELNSFGPGLLLASKLFDAGKKDTVIEFLTSVSKFWEKDLCEKAIIKIRQGQNPFKTNPGEYEKFSFNANR